MPKRPFLRERKEYIAMFHTNLIFELSVVELLFSFSFCLREHSLTYSLTNVHLFGKARCSDVENRPTLS